jgi:hypothetical protein
MSQTIAPNSPGQPDPGSAPLSPGAAAAPRFSLFSLTLLGAAIALVLDLALYLISFYAQQRQDQTWLLYAAARVLDGTQLYGPRLVETNPPLIIWLSTLPAWLAIHLHLQPLLSLHLVVTLLILASCAWSLRILRIAGVLRGRTATLIAFAFLLLAQTWVRDVDFGEREHIILPLVLPYLLAACFQLSQSLSLPERIALGLAAGLGSSIKPQYAIIPLGTELFLALWYRQLRRLWRPELLVLILTGLAYIASIRLFAPLYFAQIVPLLRDAYPTYRGDRPILAVMFDRLVYDLIFAAALALWILCRRRLRYPVAPIALLVASFCGTLSFGIQRTGWPYQTVPRNAFLLAAVLWLLAELAAPTVARLQPDKRFRLLASVVLVLVLLPASAFTLKRILHGRNYGVPDTEEIVCGALPPGTTVYVMSTNFYNFSDIVHDHLLWGGRYNHLWMLPAILYNQAAEAGGPPAHDPLPPERVQQLATLLRSNVAQDLHTFTPAVVFIAHCEPVTHPCFGITDLSFDTLAWFRQNPAFAAEWQNYHLRERADDMDVYDRISPSQPAPKP